MLQKGPNWSVSLNKTPENKLYWFNHIMNGAQMTKFIQFTGYRK